MTSVHFRGNLYRGSFAPPAAKHAKYPGVQKAFYTAVLALVLAAIIGIIGLVLAGLLWH
jgi:hypothetical protein